MTVVLVLTVIRVIIQIKTENAILQRTTSSLILTLMSNIQQEIVSLIES
jgi:hypothetical protein